MSGSSVLLVWRAVADVAVENNERRPSLCLAENVQGLLDPVEIVCIADAQDIPSVSDKSRWHILREGNSGVAFDRDVVVVINPAEIVEAEVPCQRRGFRGNSLHQAPIAANRINVVIENVEAWTVVPVGKPLLRDCHANAGCDSLPERTGCRLNTRNPVILRMAGSFAVELAKPADVVE